MIGWLIAGAVGIGAGFVYASRRQQQAANTVVPATAVIAAPTDIEKQTLDGYLLSMATTGAAIGLPQMAASAALATKLGLYKTAAEIVKLQAGVKPVWPHDEMWPGSSYPIDEYIAGRQRARAQGLA